MFQSTRKMVCSLSDTVSVASNVCLHCWCVLVGLLEEWNTCLSSNSQIITFLKGRERSRTHALAQTVKL